MSANENAVVRIARLDGLEKLNLAPEEAFVLTRVDGNSTLKQIAQILGYDVPRVLSLLKRVLDAGCLQIESVAAAPARPASKKTQGRTILDELDEEDLDPQLSAIPRTQRSQIRLLHASIGKVNHYEFFSVSPTASKAEIQKQYYKLVKENHPDRFFKKELGTYKEKLKDISKELSKVWAILGSDEKRRSYDAKLREKPAPKETADGEKKAESQKMRLTGKTLIERIALSKRYFDMGRREEDSTNFVAAANYYQISYQYDPKNEKIQKALERTLPFVQKRRADEVYDRAIDSLEHGDARTAISLMEEALQIDSRKKECIRMLSELYARTKSNLKRAKELSELAVRYYPADARVQATMGQIYMLLGLDKLADKYFQMAVKLDKTDSVAQEGLRALKRK